MSMQPSVPVVPAADLADDVVMVDVREQNEWDAGHAPQALHIPMGELPTRVGELPESDGPLAIVCRSGNRSGRVVAWLSQNGVDSVNVAGGMQAWGAAGKPMVSEDSSTPASSDGRPAGPPVRILSIQSHVAYGYAGNSAAVFPLQRLGHEVYPVLTVTFSNHTGYESVRGPVVAPDDVRAVIDGIADRGAFPDIDAVLSGYQGAEAVGAVVLDAVARVKAANPAAVYCCDPVMGDVHRGMFVREGIPEYMRDHVVPAADIVTPNQFELEYLTGRPVTTLADVVMATEQLQRMGPAIVLVTSVLTDETPADSIQMLCAATEGTWLVTTPLLPLTVQGGGDVTAAVFLAHTLTDGPRAALSRTAATMYAVLAATHKAGRRELALVAAQDSIAHPDDRFETVAL